MVCPEEIYYARVWHSLHVCDGNIYTKYNTCIQFVDQFKDCSDARVERAGSESPVVALVRFVHLRNNLGRGNE